MDLRTSYLGLNLHSPIVPSAGPYSQSLDGVKRLEDAGAAAIVLYSLFEEQLTLDEGELAQFLAQGTTLQEAMEHWATTRRMRQSPVDYLEHVRKAKESTEIPIIANLNGTPHLRWTHYAKLLEQAGADALELNFYFVPTNPELQASELEADIIETIRAIKAQIKIPVSLKLSPYYTNLSAAAASFVNAGVDGLVLFNRFFQPDIDLERMQVKPKLLSSSSQDLRLRMRWMAILSGQLQTSLAGTGGVQTAEDVVKLVLTGADVTFVCSVLLRLGLRYMQTLENGLRAWLGEHGYSSLDEIKGKLNQANCLDPSLFERAQYVKTLDSYSPDLDD